MDDTLTLGLEGEISLSSFMRAMEGFQGLVDALSQDIVSDPSIEWVITSLQAGSAVATVRGKAESDDGADDVTRVVHAFGIVGAALQANNVIPYSQRVRERAYELTKIIDGRLTGIRFKTATDDALVVRSAATNEPKLIGSIGMVEGHVLSLLSRGQLKFTLYDMVYDHGVTCYVQPGREDEIRRAWRKRVRVEGWISRDPTTGQPETVHDIGDITVVEENGGRGFERARGAVPRKPSAPRAEEAIRRVRDAW